MEPTTATEVAGSYWGSKGMAAAIFLSREAKGESQDIERERKEREIVTRVGSNGPKPKGLSEWARPNPLDQGYFCHFINQEKVQ